MVFLHVGLCLLVVLRWNVCDSAQHHLQNGQQSEFFSKTPSRVNVTIQEDKINIEINMGTRPPVADGVGDDGASDDIYRSPRELQYFCTYYTNYTYSCRTNCSDGELIPREFPNNPLLKYNDQNCTTDVKIKRAKWMKDEGIMDEWVDPNAEEVQILATCSMYRDKFYECSGVANCGKGEDITFCAGAAPWRGFFNGSVTEGTMLGNITDRSQYGAPAQPVAVTKFTIPPLKHHAISHTTSTPSSVDENSAPEEVASVLDLPPTPPKRSSN